ncbi:UNVERIFIED_CONTAM: hypothetical protein RMT77_005597 [Armadillidium vulgare]
MFVKQGLAFGTRYVQLVIPSIIERKCVSSRVCFLENKVSLIKCNFCSSYKGSTEHQSLEFQRNGFNSEEKIKLQKWIEMLKFEGARVPNNISDEQLFDIFSQTSESLRLKHLNYLFLKEVAKTKDIIRTERLKELKREKNKERSSRQKGHIKYGLWKNTMFAKTNKQHTKSLQNHRLANAIIFNQPLVIDLDFYDYMNNREVNSLSEQLSISLQRNRFNSEPFNLTLCNVDFECKKYQYFFKFMPNMSKPNFPINITSESYLDIFPKEKLVYLTPDSRNEMEEFDHEAIYIIGGLVDLYNPSPVTLAKAKRENIKTMKLPVEKYHISKKSSQNGLALHVMVNIMLDLQKNGDWKKAFKNIPRRLLYTSDESHLDVYDYAKLKKKF